MRPIIVYAAIGDDVPAGLSFMAKFKDGGKLLPLSIFGSSEEEARARAVEWWRAEEERQEQKGLRRAEKANG